MFIRWTLCTGVIESLATNKPPGNSEIFIAAFESHYVKQLGLGIVGGRVPIGCTRHSWANVCAFCCGNSIGKNRTSGSIDALRPIQLLNKGARPQKLAVCTVEDVKKTVAVSLQQQMLRRAALFYVDQHWSFGRVIVVQVVGRELEIPHQF